MPLYHTERYWRDGGAEQRALIGDASSLQEAMNYALKRLLDLYAFPKIEIECVQERDPRLADDIVCYIREASAPEEYYAIVALYPEAHYAGRRAVSQEAEERRRTFEWYDTR